MKNKLHRGKLCSYHRTKFFSMVKGGYGIPGAWGKAFTRFLVQLISNFLGSLLGIFSPRRDEGKVTGSGPGIF